MRRVVLFDENCLLCSRAVRWLAARDARRQLFFAPLQGETSRTRGLGKYAGRSGSMVVVREGEDDAVFLRSGACLEIAAALGGVWQMLFLGRLVPRFLRDGIYRLVARNRRRWRNDSTMCDLPDEAFRERLLP